MSTCVFVSKTRGQPPIFFLLLSTLFLFIYSFLNLRNNFINDRLHISTAAGRREQGGEDEVAMPSKSGMEVRSEKDGKQSYTPGLDLPHQVAWAVKICKPRPPASSFR